MNIDTDYMDIDYMDMVICYLDIDGNDMGAATDADTDTNQVDMDIDYKKIDTDIQKI